MSEYIYAIENLRLWSDLNQPRRPEQLWEAGCRTDHRTKHAPGFGIVQETDGSYTLCTPAGFRHPITRAAPPVSDDWTMPEIPDRGFQFSASELVHAIEDLRLWDDLNQPRRPEQFWEADFTEGLTQAERDALRETDLAS